MLDFSSVTTRKALGQVLVKVSERVEQDEELARYLFEDVFKQLLPTEKPKEKATKKTKPNQASAPRANTFDVYAAYAAGEGTFKKRLLNLEVDELKAIVKENGFDPAKKVSRWKTKSKIADFLLDVVRNRMQKGDAFVGVLE